MKTYVLNRESKVVHLMIDGKSAESCNLDQIVRKSVFAGGSALEDAEAVMETTGARACKRCLRNL